ncbi:response regulator [Streptomyces marincola]|uniref:response regulator n=1 Tax=Streptomyces marincola TaxID=2878388 RepID=UPI001CF5A3BA|nr:response regulator [Streptomyces marincola]UCM90501.1 response regulator [Streptomyces marincola]
MPGAVSRVLVVDDSQVIRQLIKVNLELDGFEVVTAADGAECLETVHRFRPDVITLDLVMPRLDGTRTVGRLRVDPRTAAIPLVLVSASAGDGAPAGIDALLAKPFEPAELVGLVRMLCDRGRADAVRGVKPPVGGAPVSRTLAP